MKALTNDRNLTVKADLKAVVLSNAEYKKMYSNVRKDNSLRVKFYDVKTTSVNALVEKVKALNLGAVSKLATGKFGLVTKPVWSVVVDVAPENVK